MATKLTEEEKAEMKKIKAIPNDKMKEAIAALNTFLKTKEIDEMPKAKSKGEAVALFTDAISGLMEKDLAGEIPEDVASFFNDHIVGDDGEEDSGKDAAATKPKKEKKKKKAAVVKEKDEYGFIKDSANSKVAALLAVTPTKMTQIKKELGNTYYTLMKNNTKIFGKDAISNFYVIGSPAEKLITKEPPAKPAKDAKDTKKTGSAKK